MSPFFCLWNPESPRAVSFTGAVLDRLGDWPQVMSWADFLKGHSLPEVSPDMIVRIDSPGRNWQVEKLLLSRGAARMTESNLECFSPREVDALKDDPGRVFASRQYHLGLCDALDSCQQHFKQGHVCWMQHPEDIAVMCDKYACQALLEANGVSVPRTLGVITGLDDLIARMDIAGKNRVFLKLCHGSSASGTIALERSAGRIQAFSTAKLSLGPTGVTLYNWRAVTRYQDLREIRTLVDTASRHRVTVEAWIPKAGWRGRRFDVRIVVIDGRARHVVARLAEGPFTNLQFGALRASADELRDHLGKTVFGAMCEEAERAMACFPRSLYGGVDVLLDSHKLRPYILEVNAFGDLLPSIRHQDRSTYDWEIAKIMERNQVSTIGT